MSSEILRITTMTKMGEKDHPLCKLSEWYWLSALMLAIQQGMRLPEINVLFDEQEIFGLVKMLGENHVGERSILWWGKNELPRLGSLRLHRDGKDMGLLFQNWTPGEVLPTDTVTLQYRDVTDHLYNVTENPDFYDPVWNVLGDLGINAGDEGLVWISTLLRTYEEAVLLLPPYGSIR